MSEPPPPDEADSSKSRHEAPNRPSKGVDPLRLVGEAPLSRAQIISLIVTCLLAALDGYDVLAIAFTAPGITEDWGVGAGVLGLVFSSGLVGMAIGSLLVSPLADKWGRRRVVLGNLLLMTLGMLMSAYSGGVIELSVWRGVTGIGIGAMVPIITPMAFEYSNNRYRPLAMSVMIIGFPLGGSLGGSVAAALLSEFNWTAVFLFGAGVGLLMLPIALVWLPEPMPSLMERRDAHSLKRVNRLLASYRLPAVSALPPARPRVRANTFRQIFSKGQRHTTLAIAAVNMLFIMTMYYMLNWMPQIVVSSGHSAAEASLLVALTSAGGVISCIAVGIITVYYSARIVASVLMFGLALTTIAFGLVSNVMLLLVPVALLTGVFIHGGVVALYSIMVQTFETQMRTTGVGFVMATGRAMGAVAPSLAGALFALGASKSAVSILLACGAATAGVILVTRLAQAAGGVCQSNVTSPLLDC